MTEPFAAKPHRTALTLWLLAGITLVLGTSALLYWHEATEIERRLRERESARVSLLASLFESELRSTASELRGLADGDGLRAYLSSGAETDLERAVRRAVLVASRQPNHDQLRYINEQGREVFRIKRGGEIVPAAQLQDKSDRSYVRDSLALGPNQMLLSAFDLSMENGVLEVPYKPVVRFVIPVVDRTGQRRGIYVINHLGEALIARLQEAAPSFAHRLRLLNADGHWLKAADPAHEWGFLLPERASARLAATHPTAWAKITETPVGQLSFHGGILSWRHTTPTGLAGVPANRVVTQNAFLVVASEVSEAERATSFAGMRKIFFLMTLGLMMLVGISAWFFAARQQAIVALRRSEEDLAVTLHSIGDAVLATDTAARITRMNPVGEQLTGWKLAEARGQPVSTVFNIIRAGTREPAVIPVDEVLATGESRALENHTVLIARDGTERHIADSAAPIRDRSGTIVGVVLVFRDVTAEHVAETKLTAALDELARERARLHQVFESVPVGISFSINQPDGRRSRLINTAHLTLCQLTREQVDEPGIFMRITHADDREAQARLTRELNAGTIGRFALDKRYVRPDGQVVWVILSFQRQRYADGTFEDLSIVVDITERKHAEEKTRHQNLQLQALFESLPGLYLVLTPDLKIVAATEAFLAAAMTQRDAIVGRDLFDAFPDNAATQAAHGVSNLRSSLERVKQTRQPDTMAIQRFDVQRPDGTFEERYWSPINSPLPGADGRVEYLIHRVEDVTDFMRQKQSGAADAAGTLRGRMEQMEAEMFQSSQRLQLANQQLRAANAELEAFSYSVSHDLRAPLRHIQGYVEMLGREAPPQLSEKGRRYLNTIAEAGREMGELIDNLLAFSRMGRAEMRETRVDLNPLLKTVRSNLTATVPDRPIEWKIASFAPVSGDPAMLKQVFTNLLDNAVKYTRTRQPARIEVGCAGEEDGRMIIFVRDNGAGFDMNYADKLFGVFQRLHRIDEFEGTGIGLASVRRIITRHGGRTWGEGVPDAGATFFVTLKPAPSSPTSSPPPDAPQTNFTGR